MKKPTAEELEVIAQEAMDELMEITAIAEEQGLTVAEYLVQEAKRLKDAADS